MKCGIITFPGSNCDEDMRYALGDRLDAELVPLWHKDRDLQGAELIVLPGGFSYGDHLRAGAIARYSPIMEQVIGHAKEGGKVLGICNGFQVLCEAQLLQGTLLLNHHRLFVSRNTFIRAEAVGHFMGSELNPEELLSIPVAHKEGRFYAPDEELDQLEREGRVLFRYCDAQGEADPGSDPNGSMHSIAGICNEGGNVIGMMPHPERATDAALGNTDGARLLRPLAAGLQEA